MFNLNWRFVWYKSEPDLLANFKTVKASKQCFEEDHCEGTPTLYSWKIDFIRDSGTEDTPNSSVNTHYHHVADHMTSLNFVSPFFCFSPNPKASTVQHTSVTARDPSGIKSQISDFYHFIFNLYQKEDRWTPIHSHLIDLKTLNYC